MMDYVIIAISIAGLSFGVSVAALLYGAFTMDELRKSLKDFSDDLKEIRRIYLTNKMEADKI